MAQKRLFLPPEAQNTQFWNRKHGQKLSKLYQTICFDTALQMKIVYSGLVIILWPFLAIYGPKSLFLPPEENTQFWNRKHGQKWSNLYQTMSFDNALQMRIIYSVLAIISLPFLAFYGPKKAIFATKDIKNSILKQKTWSKMEQTLPDYVFWYCPSDENCFQWICHNFMAIFSLLWPKKGYFCHQRHKILNFEIENMVKNGTYTTRQCVLILSFRWKQLSVDLS